MGFFTSHLLHRKGRARNRTRLRAAQVLYTKRPYVLYRRRYLFNIRRPSLVKRRNRYHVNLRMGARHGRYRTARPPSTTQKFR